jgi:exopolyphosphatase / guanosine-5'-triphosphate,3'-diphosphate pyrophosphatase
MGKRPATGNSSNGFHIKSKMSTRLAALDLGTNTFHLLIADVSDAGIQKVVHNEQKHVKLGEGGINKGTIASEAFHRGLEALSVFAKTIEEHHVEVVKAVGTAALRSAINGIEFVEQVKANTGINIQIIDGDYEAQLIYLGVKQSFELSATCLIMDIGGGSVEFIIADQSGLKWKKSFPIGAAKLMEKFHHTDPISIADIQSIHRHLDSVLRDLKTAVSEHAPRTLVGSAGAFETFAALCQTKTGGVQFPVDKTFFFGIHELKEVLSDIQRSTHAERAINQDILPVRTDMIVVASVLTNYIIDQLAFEEVILSTFALKEGLLLDAFSES